MQIDQLTSKIIGCTYRVHNMLGAGFLEKVYENALLIELHEAGIEVQQQTPISVCYKNQIVGQFFADLLIPDVLIIELKAAQELAKEHEIQLVNYLNATGIDHGLLINFSDSVIVKRKYRTYQKTAGQSITSAEG